MIFTNFTNLCDCLWALQCILRLKSLHGANFTFNSHFPCFAASNHSLSTIIIIMENRCKQIYKRTHTSATSAHLQGTCTHHTHTQAPTLVRWVKDTYNPANQIDFMLLCWASSRCTTGKLHSKSRNTKSKSLLRHVYALILLWLLLATTRFL